MIVPCEAPPLGSDSRAIVALDLFVPNAISVLAGERTDRKSTKLGRRENCSRMSLTSFAGIHESSKCPQEGHKMGRGRHHRNAGRTHLEHKRQMMRHNSMDRTAQKS